MLSLAARALLSPAAQAKSSSEMKLFVQSGLEVFYPQITQTQKNAASVPTRSPRPLFNLPGGLPCKLEASVEARLIKHIRENT